MCVLYGFDDSAKLSLNMKNPSKHAIGFGDMGAAMAAAMGATAAAASAAGNAAAAFPSGFGAPPPAFDMPPGG